MKRFLGKVGRFFWSWGFLKFVLWTVTLIILFYAEEDWRGARAWAATKAKWEARGETFDLQKLAPPLIPDNENLGAIPLFQGDSKLERSSEPLALEKATRQNKPGGKLPKTTLSPQTGLPDVAAMREMIGVEFLAAFPKEKLPATTLDQFNMLYPFIDDLLAVSATRPLCRLPADYSIMPPIARPLDLITGQIKLSQLLTIHAILALDDPQPGVALQDIETTQKILAGVQHDPTLVAGLVAIAMTVISDAAMADGLNCHVWNDSQLAELEQTMARVDFLTAYPLALRGEVASFTGTLDHLQQRQKKGLLESEFQQLFSSQLPSLTRFAPPWPSGWWDENKSLEANFILTQMEVIDSSKHRAYPGLGLKLRRQTEEESQRWDALGPWRIFFTISSSPLQVASRFVYGQVRIDEARIACALERYRLVHGGYPSSLDALAPQYIAALPHDVIDGQPYRYRLRPNGTFLLYSVGWDEKDDGGTVSYRKDEPQVVDQDHGDWVWPSPK